MATRPRPIPVNHEAWLEYVEGRLLVYWGHYPRVDGTIEAHAVTEALVVEEPGSTPKPLALRRVKEGCPRGPCLEARVSRQPALALVAYQRRATKAGGAWYTGLDALTARAAGLEPEESLLITGLAKLCTTPGCPATGHPLDAAISDGRATILAYDTPTKAHVTIYSRGGDKLLETEAAELQLPPNTYVIVAKRDIPTTSTRHTTHRMIAVITLHQPNP